MTRLKTEWIEYMLDGMDEYNRNLQAKTGMNLGGLIQTTFSIGDEAFEQKKQENKIAVVPITQGEGIIGNFSESIAAILQSIGFDAQVTAHTDVDGIYDARLAERNILFFADDIRYLALNVKTGVASDNNYATALGFIQVLSAMMQKQGKDISKETILQIGYGIVGKEAEKLLLEKHINFAIYDKDRQIIEGLPYQKLTSVDEIKQYHYILDFTNEGGWLTKEDLNPNTLYASPGVPYSMNEAAENCFEDRAIHDNLEIGTAIMLGQTII
ncbi:pyrrolysine biosynthesis protein PylD [Clostridiales Family XIII bacterium PM5-7]